MNSFVGIDVGGTKKGFHGVALIGDQVERFSSRSPHEMVAWCRSFGAVAVGVDAPCGWSQEDSSRACEREMRIGGAKPSCYATPSLARAQAHTKGFYGWVFNGMDLYAALAREFPLAQSARPEFPFSFETFPHAVVCALAGRVVPAQPKEFNRRQVLRTHGIDDEDLTNIDFVDAALCALTARCVANGEAQAFGDSREGLIFVPTPRAHAKIDSMKIEYVRQIAFAVKDIDAAKRFYGQTMGLMHLFDAGPHLAFFQMGSTRLMLSQVAEGQAEQDTTIYCLVPNAEEAHREAMAEGAESAGEPHVVAELADHDLWIGFVKDTDGRVIGLMEERRR